MNWLIFALACYGIAYSVICVGMAINTARESKYNVTASILFVIFFVVFGPILFFAFSNHKKAEEKNQ